MIAPGKLPRPPSIAAPNALIANSAPLSYSMKVMGVTMMPAIAPIDAESAKDNENIKLMADLLRQGSTLTRYSCPACFSPLLEVKGTGLWCASCKKEVRIVNDEEVEKQKEQTHNFSSLESTILKKIQVLIFECRY